MTIKQILMKRDGMSSKDADKLIEDAQDALHEYLGMNEQDRAFNICEEFFGLEPDYLMELI